MSTQEPNERVRLLSQMIGMDPKFWPFPIPRNLNVELIEIAEGSLKYKVTVQKDWLNPLKIMHGGIMVTLMDEAMGCCGYSLNKEHGFATINLTADYISSAKEGDILYIHGKIEKIGRQLIHASSYIEHENGKIVAKSTSNLLAFHPRKS